MTSAFLYWWLALPILGVPVWLHRRRRQRIKALPLATARFLPKADPQQLRVWQWVDRVLLLVRCLLLVGAIAWLADVALPWRGTTVLVGPGVDAAWATQQIGAAGLQSAKRLDFCAADCAVPTANILSWLSAHEREWSAGARMLVLANAGDVAMPAGFPPLAHRIDVRIKPAAAPARAGHHVVIASARSAEWRALFAAFDNAGDGAAHYVVDDAPNEKTELIVWDAADAPQPAWHAPLWWVVDGAAFPELRKAVAINGMRYADSARGRLWSGAGWPPTDADAARVLYETWQALHVAPAAYAMPSQTIAPGRTTPLVVPSGSLHALLALAMAALFATERILTHARRR